jgi:Glycosyl hydrolase family 26
MKRRRARPLALLSTVAVTLIVATVTGLVLYVYMHHRGQQLANATRPTTGAAATRRPEPLQTLPSTRTYLGIFQRGVTNSYGPVAHFARAVGRKPDIVLYYNSWDEPFSLKFARRAAEHGAAPFVQMEPLNVSMASIVAGDSDPYLRKYAKEVRDFGHPVILSFASEMNGNWYPWGWTHTPPRVWVAAWRHVVTLFRQQGAQNVTWMWTISHDIAGTGPLRAYWPGSRYVSWVGIDGYYFLQTDTFQRVFGRQIRRVRLITGAPIFLSEVGIGQVANQVQKIPGLFTEIHKYHLLGLLWFDVAQHEGLYHQDWRLEGHPAAVAEFRQGLAVMESP